MTDPMRKEFEVFAKTSQKDDGMIGATAAVCTLIVDKGEMTLTKVFHAKKKDSARAEDELLEWLWVEPNVVNSNRLDIRIFLNYSPLETTSLNIVDNLKSLETQGKRVNVTVRFVALHGQGEDDEDNEEHKIGLLALKKAQRVKLGLFEESDWVYLLSVLRDPMWIQKQLKGTRSSRIALREIFQGSDGLADDDDDIEEHGSMTKAAEVPVKVPE